MKHTLALVLMVLGLVGCSTKGMSTFSTTVDDGYFPYVLYRTANFNNSSFTRSSLYASQFKVLMEFYSRPNLCVDGSIGVGSKVFCLKSELKLKKRVEDYQKAKNLIAENQQLNAKREIWLKEHSQFQVAANEESIRLVAEKLEQKKSKCRDYGFKDDSDGMGMCLIELDKLAAIKNQSEQANQAQLQALQQQQAEAKRQREANALMNLGAIIGGAGTPAPSSSRSKATTPSYPTYTSSMTVPSNQLCPQLTSRLVKQEVVRGNRICYYQ